MTSTHTSVAVVALASVPGLAAQTSTPTELFEGAQGLSRARGSGAQFIWLLGPGVDPRADALERLLEARSLHAGSPGDVPPSIVSGMVVGSAGEVIESQLPAWGIGRPDLPELIGQRLLPIRHARFANCLIDASCLTRHGSPDDKRYGPYASIEWSARVLRNEPGYFVPASVAELHQGPGVCTRGPGGVSTAAALPRFLRSGTWTRGDLITALGGIRPRRGAAR